MDMDPLHPHGILLLPHTEQEPPGLAMISVIIMTPTAGAGPLARGVPPEGPSAQVPSDCNSREFPAAAESVYVTTSTTAPELSFKVMVSPPLLFNANDMVSSAEYPSLHKTVVRPTIM